MKFDLIYEPFCSKPIRRTLTEVVKYRKLWTKPTNLKNMSNQKEVVNMSNQNEMETVIHLCKCCQLEFIDGSCPGCGCSLNTILDKVDIPEDFMGRKFVPTIQCYDCKQEYQVGTLHVCPAETQTVVDYPIMKFFDYAHLPEHLQEVSMPFNILANELMSTLEPGPERDMAIRKLLEAKDCAVRAKLYPGD